MALDLTAIVLTFNEEIDLPACLDSLGRLECRIVVVDSGSDDRTVDIAEQAGAEVFHHEFESQAQGNSTGRSTTCRSTRSGC